MKQEIADFSELDALKNHPVSAQIDQTFRSVIKEEKVKAVKAEQSAAPTGSSVDELSLSDDGEFAIDLGGADEVPPESAPIDEGFELSLNEDEGLDLAADEDVAELNADSDYGDISLDEEVPAVDDLPAEEQLEDLGDLSFEMSEEEAPALPDDGDVGLSLDDSGADVSLDLGSEESADEGLDLIGDELSLGGDADLSLGDDESEGLDLGGEELNLGESAGADEELSLSFGSDDSSSEAESDLSDDARKKLEEIDALMVEDASRVNIAADFSDQEDLDQSLVGEDINLDNLNFSSEEEDEAPAPVEKTATEDKKKKKKEPEVRASYDKSFSDDLREISGAYSGEMERLQATISNLRSDREELLVRIQKLEDEKVLQNRQGLSLRAELDEKKIELTIIRKKLNEEIAELKDRLKLHDEKRLILEEKNRILLQELDKAAQKNKIDVKKIQMREKELEQKLELLKADAETQIRNRDLKILELKRKIDSMEFDMESISQQEKRSVESRFELEDKLEKAIKTLRNAINVLEDENERAGALSALKKNLDV